MTGTEDIIRLKDAEIWSLREEVNKLTIQNARMEVQLDFQKQQDNNKLKQTQR
tara:strand:+ start:452 stop:610 length:159 start_codon:yes stop_codon:yes gene_type:complete